MIQSSRRLVSSFSMSPDPLEMKSVMCRCLQSISCMSPFGVAVAVVGVYLCSVASGGGSSQYKLDLGSGGAMRVDQIHVLQEKVAVASSNLRVNWA